ncbi:hypothetical protein [Paracoccus mutanolyticus]|uniref:hypothetical protein n=1 Tax=Paracoccus mutanolyticus TaxID=1499308 RepID=UPI001676AF56|nr:hypothetical protein [Paracoccus mutanolyticus]
MPKGLGRIAPAIVIPDGTPRPEDSVQTYTPTARPGSRLSPHRRRRRRPHGDNLPEHG